MSGRPDYFEPIRQRASQRWDQLEKDPELAGPWHQLFKQVQSPRHILSELLQNADDAGATEASVQVEDGRFVFAHNGEDFTEEHFGSLCRFGYSNKRALHTIGFRGIGFKSTFSLGGSVELHTPTLSVAFSEKRFTEPSWIERAPTRAGHTTVIAVIRDSHRQREVEKNLQEWISSPVSLLFFRSIRRLRIDDKQVYWKSQGTGPIPNTEWMAIHEDPEQRFLVAQSAAEPFPADALTEIRQERMLGDGQDSDFPPCKVEVVLGAKGRLYVVLPTGVETSLPFACNAPFIQDPARLKVKDPETSPTNRWLLERVGALAASVMQKWLEENSASLSERSQAYGFFPDVGRDDDSLDGTCAAIVQTAFDAATKGKTYVLTNDGELTTIRQSIAIPEELFDVWPEGQATALLDRAHRPAFSRSVPERAQARLVRRGVVDKVDKNQILNMLQENHLPKPGNWRALLKLWSYVAPDITGYRKLAGTRDIRIFPVQGKDVLHSATEIVRLGEKRLLQTDEDWDFLAAHLLVLNQNWPRFLAEQRREAEERGDNKLLQEVDAAYAIFGTCGLEAASDVKSVIDQVARDFFGGGPIRLPDCVRLTQIAAKLGAAVEGSFRFVTRDNKLRNLEHVVLFDSDGTLEAMLPEAWCAAHLLHPDYSKTFESCSRDDWVGWIQSGRAGLHTCMPLLQVESTVWGRSDLGTELTRREIASSPYYHYVTSQFRLEDWDFEESLWHYWTVLSKEDAQLWPRLVERLLLQPEAFWSKARKARALQVATTNRLAAVTNDPLLPAWILKLRELPCLRDTRGFCRNPAELLRRTPETESLMDVEAFIHGQFDTEAVRPLLKLLGVRDIPTGPARLLDCLRALSRSDSPPSHEVDKWYRRLDRMLETCSTNDFSVVKMALRDERLILTEAGGWSSGASAFLSSDEEDVPGAATVRASVRDLMLWRKVGIAERPTAELAIAWLGKLPSGEVLSRMIPAVFKAY